MKVKEESEKVGLKLNIQKTKIMAFGPITSWEIDGETVETVSDFIFLGSKITADGDCRHGIKRRLLTPWKESYDQPSSILRKRHWHPTPVLLPGESHGCRSLVGCSPWGCEESDTGDLPKPGIKPTSLISPALAGRFFTRNATWEAPNRFSK